MSDNHADLIDALGPEVIRRQFDLTPQRLCNWKRRGIPFSHRPAIAQLATLLDKPLPDGFLHPPKGKTT